MLKVLSTDIWPTIKRKAKRSEHLQAAVAYVTEPGLLPLRRGDVLVTDASNASIAAGRTSARALERYLKSGVNVFSLPDLHAKVVVLDDCAVIGSANASQHSASVYFEAAVVSDRPDVVGQALSLVSVLASKGTRVSPAFVKRILKIPVIRTAHPRGGPRRGNRVVPSLERRSWLVSLRGDATYRGDTDVVDEVNETVRKKFGGRGAIADWFIWGPKCRLEVGDQVVECWRPRSKISTTRSVRVFRHGHVRKIFKEPGVNETTVHCIWASDREETSLSWTAFLRLARDAGITRKLTYNSTVELKPEQSSKLFDFWRPYARKVRKP